MYKTIKCLIAVSGGLIGWLFVEIDSLFYALITFVVLDYITGILAAIHNKRISSAVGLRGIVKKIMMFFWVIVGNIFDRYVLGNGSTLRTMIVMFYLSNEAISILENVGETGLPLPLKLKEILQQLRNNK